ncbi:MAG: zinc ABC transporter substrate-binding protein [Burkholderiaceae bacterium]|nr:zinc ABC transporter substrate-binding protein [Burkholderiaceae bacterium]
MDVAMLFGVTRRAFKRCLLFGLTSAALMSWCMAQAAEPPAAPVLKVVATFSVLADIAREVGGPAVEVTALVGPNADAHVFEPTPSDVRRVAHADLVITNGLRFEGWIDRLIAASGYRGPIVVASRSIATRQLSGGADPHAWQSLANGQRYADNIRAALVAALAGKSPTRVAEVEARAAAYQQRLAALERDTRARIDALPAERRRVITSHDAFGYFSAAYGVTFIAPRGWTTGSEPSAEAVARIVRQARESKASALLVENISDPRLIERIAREAGLKVGGELYSDALSPPGTEADTYLRMFEHNVRTLVEAMSIERGKANGFGAKR